MVNHILFPFIGREIGGSHVSAFALAQSLAKDFSFRCTVIARAESSIAAEAAALGLNVLPTNERTSSRHNPIYDVARVVARTNLLRQLGRAIVHTNDIGSLQSWVIPSRLAGMPVIYHHRALNRRVLPNTLLIGSADHVITISDETSQSVDFLRPDGVTAIIDPFAIDLSTDRASARAWLQSELKLEEDAMIIGFVGNFWRRKRPEFFIQIAANLAASEKRVVFVVFGRDGDLTVSQLEARVASTAASGRFHFVGFRLPVERNIAALDLLLMPALREPLGRTPIEAALLGTPYVATDDAGHSEIWRRWRGGLLMDKNSGAAAFAEATMKVLRAADTFTLPAQARLAMAEEVAPRRHAERVLEVYRHLDGST